MMWEDRVRDKVGGKSVSMGEDGGTWRKLSMGDTLDRGTGTMGH